jgi:DNA repair protein RadD
MTLRPYQSDAVEAVYRHLREQEDNPCVVLPTASGKTYVIATICRDAVQLWNGRVLILAHVRELLEQITDKLHAAAPDLPVGLYSAGLRRRDLGYAITVAGIQSVYERAPEIGPVDLVIVDEAHLIPPDGEGMYRTFLADMKQINPLARVIGLTATPFRMKSGTICSPDNVLNDICFEVSVRELIVQGYLCALRTKAGSQHPQYDQLHVRGGEYVAGEVEELMDDENLVLSACREIVQHTQDRRSVLIFASGVAHGQHIAEVIQTRHQVECGFVCAETLPSQRDELIHRFRNGRLRYLCNVNVLTTGFDAPNIDCVAMVRPTLSPGLYYQMVGRGFRLHPEKPDCLVLDFGGNVLRHGPVDQLRISPNGGNGNGEAPAKECPECHAVIAAGYATCPECGHEFPERQRSRHEATAGTEAILSDETTRTEHEVREVLFAVHTKRDAPEDHPRSMRVDYRVGWNQYISEWVCFEHTGYARAKAEAWWRQRSNDPTPSSAEEAVELAQAGSLAPTRAITVRSVAGEKYDRIVKHKLGDKPPPVTGGDLAGGEPEYEFQPCAESDVPF